ncbi:hypothetical protein F5B19DRAFT_496718 [Rostrohypoxylon terebratum]|nr:hypothetical protein F5B19DRAFT_496718 [Rostrohypoxylon terebratum]
MACMFLVFGVPSGVKIMSDTRIPSKLASSLRSLGGRFQRNFTSYGSGTGASSWPRWSMIMNNSHAGSSRTYYHKIDGGNGGMLLMTTNSTQGQSPNESTEYFKSQKRE